MNSVFNQNKIYNEDLILNWQIVNGNFTTNGQYYIMQYSTSVQNIISLSGYSDNVLGTNIVFTYQSESSIFFPGETITLKAYTGDSTAVVVSDDSSGNLVVKNISNLSHPFAPGLVIIGKDSGAIATIYSIMNSYPNLNPIDSNNYFTKEIRYSFDGTTWTGWFHIDICKGTIFNYSSESALFLPGEIITLSAYTGDSTAIVLEDTGTYLIVKDISNKTHPFVPTLAIKGLTSGSTTTIFSIIPSFPNPNSNLNCWIHIKYLWNTSGSTPQSIILEDVNLYGTRKIDEIYQPVKISPGDTAVYAVEDTYKVFSMQDFKVYTLNNVSTAGVDIQFRFTQSQGRQWSSWYRLTTDNLKSIQFDPIRFCNFQFGFANNSAVDFNLQDLELIGDFQNITTAYNSIARLGLKTQCNPLKNLPTAPCDSSCTTKEELTYDSPWNISNKDTDNSTNSDLLFKVNKRSTYGKLPELNNYLNGLISERNGWKVSYGLADPDRKGIDIILHEQQLHNIIAIKDVNIIVPGNKFPNEDITLSGLDLDLIQTFEVHIVKDQFKNTFGVEFRPGTKDIIYFCDRNQMWEVDQMIPIRTGFNIESYWRVILRKYNERASRQFINKPDKDFVDALTKNTSLDSLFGIAQDNEYQKISKNEEILLPNNAQQYNDKSMINIVKSIGPGVTYVTNNRIWNSSLTISMSQYQLPLTSRGQKLVNYNLFDMAMAKSDNRAISMWFMSQDFQNTWDYTLLSNFDYNLNKGYNLHLYNGALVFALNGNSYSLPLNNTILPNVWYCLLVNLNQQQDELELVIYQRQSENGQSLTDSKLIQVVKMIFAVVPDSFSIITDSFIGGCDLHTTNTTGNINNWFLTNIRVYKQSIAKSKRNIVLNEKIVSDSHLILLSDSAEGYQDSNGNKIDNYGNI